MQYRYDTHVHTAPVSRCARASVRETVEFYRNKGFDGIFIANHFLDGNINIDPSEPYEKKIEFYFSDYEEDQMPMFMADLISMGKNVREEKLLDCLDLIEIMVDPQFIYELCTQDGQLQYMLPADRRLYPMLAELDPIYQQFYSILDSDENGVIRYGTHFYEDFNQIGDELMQDLIEDRILPRRQGSSLFSRGESSNGNPD